MMMAGVAAKKRNWMPKKSQRSFCGEGGEEGAPKRADDRET
jgi:hypothetical protein